MMTRTRLIERLEQRRQEIVDLCRSLVRIPSEDPPGDNRAICRYLREHLEAHGIATRVYAPDPARPNLVATIPFGSFGPNIVFNGHMETLPVGDRSRWTYDPFAAIVSGGRLYGRGAICMKAGLAALTSAALAINEFADRLRGSLTLTFVSDEVNGGRLGTGYLVEHVPSLQADAVLVAEGGSAINFGHKGVTFLEFRSTGTGGHGAYGYKGHSAVHRMLVLLGELRAFEDMEVTVPQETLARIEESRAFFDAQRGLGATDALLRVSVNVGTLHGGRKVNVIADECTAQVDVRLPPGMTVRTLMSKIDRLLARHSGVTARILWANEPTASSPDHSWFQLLREQSTDILGAPLPFVFSHGFTDARFFRLKGIPAAAIGFAGRNVGAPDEFLDTETLVSGTKIFAAATYDALSSPTGGY